MEPLEGAVGEIDLVHTAAAKGDDGVQLLHHVDVVQTVEVIPAPAHVFKTAGHIFLPVQVVGLVGKAPQGFVCVVHHPGHFLGGGQALPLFKEVSAFFQRKSVDGDVGGIQGGNGIQRAAEAVKVVLRKSGD